MGINAFPADEYKIRFYKGPSIKNDFAEGKAVKSQVD